MKNSFKNSCMHSLLTPIAALSTALTFPATSIADLNIIDVRRNIPLSDNEPVYRDYFINAGEGSGLKKNLVVTALRKVSVRDASGAQSFGEVLIPVGKLKIIAVYSKVAVAREWEMISRDEAPLLEQVGVMSGDQIDLAGSYIEKRKKRQEVSAPATVVEPTAQAQTPPPMVAPAQSVEKPPTPPETLEKVADSGNTSAL